MARLLERLRPHAPEPIDSGVVAGQSNRCSGVITLFTDYGLNGPYVGQLKSRLIQTSALLASPSPTIVDLMHDAPQFDPQRSAYLLAPCLPYLPSRSVLLAVVDPGVGSERAGLAIKLADSWLVGPDNGLMAVAAKRFGAKETYRLAHPQTGVSPTFHGRDVFADVAVELAQDIAQGDPRESSAHQPTRAIDSKSSPADFGQPHMDRAFLVSDMDTSSTGAIVGRDWPEDIDEIIYRDGYGNLHTGRRAATVNDAARLVISESEIRRAEKFADVAPGELFWYENSMGMVEVAANCESASHLLGEGGKIGTRFGWIN
ncbi:SAM hydrolase/SAM-dependent halogenase family protein [Halorhodospira halochloris]|uniref:SAM hydrolase/SAM-dependent halogenase family protein n=1 Tax=Halorhodospira halochloris TaxID=1052 RepID=UPI00076F80AF|nr:SAM-dependent chlorinase/fluorinase [Halorhodospira halochloris]MBK1652786.1 hypothetical protein [Halorhodospira halochloris]